jgi:hypothetical protein
VNPFDETPKGQVCFDDKINFNDNDEF